MISKRMPTAITRFLRTLLSLAPGFLLLPINLLGVLSKGNRKFKKHALPFSFGAVLILAPIIFILFKNAQTTQAVWWDDSWLYRKSVLITNSGSAQTDYQIAVTLDTATLISAGKMLSDCGDVRITDATGKILPYWIEKFASYSCNTSTTKIWTKVPDILASGTTIYLYYGNSSATSKESGIDTFLFFDDFSGTQNEFDNTWTKVNNSTPATFTVANGYLEVSGGSSPNLAVAPSVGVNDYEVDADYYAVSSIGNAGGLLARYTPTGNYYHQELDGGSLSLYRFTNFSYASISSTGSTNAANTWYRISIKTVGSTISAETQDQNKTTSGVDANFPSGQPGVYRWDNNCRFDNFRVRKAASTEPSTGNPGTEQQSPGPAGYWKFDEGNGQTVHSTASSDMDGILGATSGTDSSDPSWQDKSLCISERCLYFDGTDDYANLDSLVNKVKNYSAGSISFWVNTNDVTVNRPLIALTDASSNGNLFWIAIDTNSKIYVLVKSTLADVVRATSTNPINSSTNYWHHIVYTSNSNGNKVYVNGSEVPMTYTSGSSATQAFFSQAENGSGNCDKFTIGSAWYQSGSPATYFHGKIDEVKLYPYARSAEQVKTDYIRGAGSAGSSVSFATGSEESLSNGLVGYWRMEESSTPFWDSSGNSNSATWQGDTTYSSGKFGNSTSFDGADDSIRAIDSPSLSVSGTGLTLAAWIYPVGSVNGAIIHKGGQYSIYRTSTGTISYADSIQWSYASNGYYGSTPANQWSYVVATFDGTNRKIYVNGSLVGTINKPGSITDNSTAVLLGCYDDSGTGGANCGDTFAFSGKIDEARIYNRTLSAQEISQLYKWAPGPVAHYKMDENTGTTSIYDNSGNNQTGVMQGNMSNDDWVSGKFGSAISFDGDDDSIYVTDTPTLSPTSAVTVEAWLYMDAAPGDPGKDDFFGAVQKDGGYSGYPNYGFMVSSSSKITFGLAHGSGLGESAGLNSNTALSTKRWYHVAVTYDQSIPLRVIYLNGVSDATSAAYSQTLLDSTGVLRIASGDNRKFSGIIDDVRVYNYARTPEQIVSDMNAGHPAPGSPVGSPAMHLRMDEGYGDTAHDSGSQGNNGNLAGTCPGDTTCPAWSNSGRFNKGLNFDGNDDYLTFNSISFGASDPWTASFWMNASSDGSFIVLGRGTQSSYIAPYTATNEIRVRNTSGEQTGISTTLDPNNWYMITVTAEGTTYVKVYVNGKYIGNVTPGAAGTAIEFTRFGKAYSNDSYTFNGVLDELKIYNFALTQEQVSVEYNQGQSQVIGAPSTASDGSTPDSSASREYCVPGDTSSCSAPIVMWKLDEGTGTTANDSSGNTSTGTLVNTPIRVPGKVGTALQFNGSNQYVNIPALTSITAPYTVEFWFDPAALPGAYQTLLSLKGVNGYPTFNLASNNKLLAYAGNEKYRYGTRVFSSSDLNKWWHVAFVVADSSSLTNWKVYLNGIDDTGISGGNSGTYYEPGAYGTIGNSATNQYFKGKIDDIRIYNYVRTPAQVAWDYNQGEPIAHWRLDECQGTTAYDSSGRGNNGTITIGGTGSQTSAGTCGSGTGTEAWNNGTSGKLSNSLSFDGTDDVVTAPNIDTGIITVSAWVHPDNMPGSGLNTRIVTKYPGTGNPNGSWGMDFRNSAGVVSTGFWFFYNSGNYSWAKTTESVPTGSWTHLVATFDGTNTKFYVNGNLKNTAGASVTSIPSYTQQIGIGEDVPKGTLNEYFDGQIDEVKIFNYALTAAQVKTLYNDGAVTFGQ